MGKTLTQMINKHTIGLLLILFSYSYAFGQKENVLIDPRDEQEYRTLVVDGQVWMAENLNFETLYGSFCYDYDNNYCDKYGRLYTWEAAMSACPDGWHLPSDEEWKMLELNLGLQEDELDDDGYRGEGLGADLKSEYSWRLLNGQGLGTNKSGFSALPGGYYNHYDDTFSLDGDYGNWWSSTEHNLQYALGRSLYYDENQVCRFTDDKKYGCSVRCVQN